MSADREGFGIKLADRESVQIKLGDVAHQIQIGRLLTMHAAWKLDQGARARKEVSMAKVQVADALHNAADVAIQLNGARGYSKDTILEWIYRYARSARLVDGASEVHKMVLARFMREEGRDFWTVGLAERLEGSAFEAVPRRAQISSDIARRTPRSRSGRRVHQLRDMLDVGADAADAEMLVVRFAGFCGGFIGRPQFRALQFSGNAHGGAEIVRADQQHVDAGHRGDRVRIGDASGVSSMAMSMSRHCPAC